MKELDLTGTYRLFAMLLVDEPSSPSTTKPPVTIQYMNIVDESIEVMEDDWYWLEDGRDVDGNPVSRYATGKEESVWVDENLHEVIVD